MKKQLKLVVTLFIAVILISVLFSQRLFANYGGNLQVRSIDTMKYSRDLAREKLHDPSFDVEIDREMKQIADTGATHVAIATPYDKEFLPILKRWVSKARKYKLHIWFRGNFSGWEGWFDYPKIDRTAHTQNIEAFILINKDLFENGDIFTSCPECENGGPGDPRKGDIYGYRRFLINEYTVTKRSFAKINKKVTANYYSMNGDVARLVMDKNTTKALDGIITIDHYVKTPEQLIADIHNFALKSGGKVVLGEFGAPIPDIHGVMTEKEQADWVAGAFAKILKSPDVIGVNYWTNIGSSTALWSDIGMPKQGVEVLKNAYTNSVLRGKVTGANGKPVPDAVLTTLHEHYASDADGIFSLPYLFKGQTLQISATGFKSKSDVTIDNNKNGSIVLVFNNQGKKSISAQIMDILLFSFKTIRKLLTNS
jgi:hypothetical protein